jgi:ComF family protein
MGLFFPVLCPVCGNLLVEGEEKICIDCLADMPLSFFWSWRDNKAKKIFCDLGVTHAASLLFYRRESRWKQVIYDFKYNYDKKLGGYFSSLFAAKLAESGWEKEIDIVVPVPLHFLKKWMRGYNQAQVIAEQLGRRMEKPVVEQLLIRRRYTLSQTKKDKDHRLRAMRNVFRVNMRYEKMIRGARVLIVDDVLTTGSTLRACAEKLIEAGCASVCMATLAVVE